MKKKKDLGGEIDNAPHMWVWVVDLLDNTLPCGTWTRERTMEKQLAHSGKAKSSSTRCQCTEHW